MADAVHAEYADGPRGTPIVDALTCALRDTKIAVDFVDGSPLRAWHGQPSAVERTNCSYGLATGAVQFASANGMRVAATDPDGEIRAVWRPDHPFFVATLYQPQLSSAPERPHPVFTAFVAAVHRATH